MQWHMLASLVNGAAADHIAILDRGLQFGDGLFETIPVHAGRPLCLERHLRRLRGGCERLGIPFPEGMDDEADELLRTCGSDCPNQAVMKITVTRGSSARGYGCLEGLAPNRILSLFPWPEWPSDLHSRGVDAGFGGRLCEEPPELAGLKHLNRLPQVMARRALPKGRFEALLDDARECIIEGTMSNVFARICGQWHTPDLRHAGIRGIVRDCVIEDWAKQAGESVRVADLKRGDLLEAEEVCLANSLIGIVPVRRLDARAFDSFKGSQGIAACLSELRCIMPADA